MQSFKKRFQNLTDQQKDILLGLLIILAVATLYYFQWAYYLTGLEGSKVNIDQPERYFWWANDSVTYRATGEWLFGRDDNDMIGNRPWLYPLPLGLARTLSAGNAESVLWVSQFLMWLGSGLFIYLTLQNAAKSTPLAMIGAGVFTLFLSDPDSYEGGELVIDSAGAEDAVKLPAGSLVLYPSTSIHRVSKVTRGVRLCAVGWIKSRVRSAEDRATLFDLERIGADLAALGAPGEIGDRLANLRNNLLRRWGD